MTTNETTQFLTRPDGRIGYDVAGTGSLIVLVPGMGDLRASYRFLAPALREAGYRVASADLRGHGDSDTTFASYGDEETATDVTALIEELGGPAIIVGNSMAAGAGVIVAAERPELVSGLVLVGPFVRNPPASKIQLALFHVLMAKPWVATSWNLYLPKLYAGCRPSDFDLYRKQVAASIKRPGYAKAFSLTTRLDHTPAEVCLAQVKAPTLVVMGELDPDFKAPRTEADWIGTTLKADVVMVPEAGHYPQSQRADITTPAIIEFVQKIHA